MVFPESAINMIPESSKATSSGQFSDACSGAEIAGKASTPPARAHSPDSSVVRVGDVDSASRING
jgi:hypothetical protein